MPYSLLIYTSVAPDKPPPHTPIEARNTDVLACAGYLLEVRLQGSEDIIFGVYQYWVHQNPGDHIDGRII